ncbi:MAG: amidohydrolase [Fimbriimonadaceae bacterium]|jgi:hypothetical protein|nr:amidohydrolase [Fimbriimonadaceae bacterium]
MSPSVVEQVGTQWRIPGFVDSHCHILPAGLDLLRLNLSGCGSPEEVLSLLDDWDRANPGSDFLLAVHYDQNRYPGAQHLSRHQLDRVVSHRPVMLRHSNGHASVVNSKALELAKVGPNTPDPVGGTFVRDSSGELTGVLLETAHGHVASLAPLPTKDQMVEAILRAGESMASLGITCATDMMTGCFTLADELEAYHLASQKGCKVRLRLCLQWAPVLGRAPLPPELLRDLIDQMDPNLCRVIGLKIFADGAIGSATAAIYDTFATTGESGTLTYPEEELARIIALIDENGWQVAIHSIGDRSTDLVLDGFEKTSQPSRHRLEHAMILSDSQIERIARVGCHVTMQPEFLLRFGRSYQGQLPATASKLKRVRSCLAAGIPLSFSSDRPVVPGNPWDGIQAAVCRPEGFDPSESIDLDTAIWLYTVQGHVANGEPGAFGDDWQIYDEPPAPGLTPVSVWREGAIMCEKKS